MIPDAMRTRIRTRTLTARGSRPLMSIRIDIPTRTGMVLALRTMAMTLHGSAMMMTTCGPPTTTCTLAPAQAVLLTVHLHPKQFNSTPHSNTSTPDPSSTMTMTTKMQNPTIHTQPCINILAPVRTVAPHGAPPSQVVHQQASQQPQHSGPQVDDDDDDEDAESYDPHSNPHQHSHSGQNSGTTHGAPPSQVNHQYTSQQPQQFQSQFLQGLHLPPATMALLQYTERKGYLDEIGRYLKVLPPAPDFCYSKCTGRRKAVCVSVDFVLSLINSMFFCTLCPDPSFSVFHSVLHSSFSSLSASSEYGEGVAAPSQPPSRVLLTYFLSGSTMLDKRTR
ncbi:hypothetical protein BDZ97DRAFT_191573 [Flammula alnicola]|nr:hypothetical protein BDZ97DRAFT_191573 [Flammula alnicola]